MPLPPPSSLRLRLAILGLGCLGFASPATAAPELAVVGLHDADLGEEQNAAAADALAAALDATGKVDALGPEALRTRIAGREDRIVEDAFLGPGRKALEEGRILYERAEFEDALVSLGAAVARLREALPVTTDNRPLIEALLLQGLANFSLGESDAARLAFEEVVRLDPGRRLDPVNYSGPTVTFFEEARQAAVAAGTGTLVVKADEGDEVWVNGRAQGTGTITVEGLPVGAHAVLVRAGDGQRGFEFAQVQADRTATVDPARSWALQMAAAENDGARSRQAGLLYGALGTTLGTGLVLLAGETADGGVKAQLLDTRSGTWSVPVQAEGGDALAGLVAAMPELAGTLDAGGNLSADRVQARALPLDIRDNTLLVALLLEPKTLAAPPTGPVAELPPEEEARRGVPWWVWAGGGVLVAGGATTAAVVVAQGGGEAGEATGTVVVGPMP